MNITITLQPSPELLAAITGLTEALIPAASTPRRRRSKKEPVPTAPEASVPALEAPAIPAPLANPDIAEVAEVAANPEVTEVAASSEAPLDKKSEKRGADPFAEIRAFIQSVEAKSRPRIAHTLQGILSDLSAERLADVPADQAPDILRTLKREVDSENKPPLDEMLAG